MKTMTNQGNKKNSALNELLNEITPQEQRKTDRRMQLAMKIDEARKANKWSRQDLANALGKQKSVITKWLSGTHNFNIDTLMDIEDVLNIKLLDVEQPKEKTVVVLNVNVKSEEPVHTNSVAYENDNYADLNYYASEMLRESKATYNDKAKEMA